MDFAANLASQSVKDLSAAAVDLRAEGVNGSIHLPALLENIQRIDSTKELDRFEEALLGYGAMTMGDIVGQVGFDFDLPLHCSVLNCILALTEAANIKVSVHAIYGLGNLRTNHANLITPLSRLVVSDLRNDENENVTLRAIALRILKRLDPAAAQEFFDTPAYREYIHAVEHWLETDASTNEDTRKELKLELQWQNEN